MQERGDAGSEGDTGDKIRLRPQARLKKRADFLKASKGQRVHGGAFTLQAVRRKGPAEADLPRFGFTVTKKLGGAVVRNRIRRRLKEALRLAPNLSTCRDYDYVILGRQSALQQEFKALQEELGRAISEVHARREASRLHKTRPGDRDKAASRSNTVRATPFKMKD
ncbi:MAG: ribonuclease P protein component [Beijerinckiaceae bacterium]|nr:MAG: ribonuclease P protein component [Beijerinckiaceae bacterium]